MARMQLSANELDDLSRGARDQGTAVQNLISAGDSAINGASDLRSSAMTDFSAGWNDDKTKLSNLREDLKAWSDYCKKQADTARQLNQPFRTR